MRSARPLLLLTATIFSSACDADRSPTSPSAAAVPVSSGAALTVRRWDPAAPLTQGRFGHQVGVGVDAAGEQVLYAFGGMELESFEETTTPVVEAYHPPADTWIRKALSPMADSRVPGL